MSQINLLETPVDNVKRLLGERAGNEEIVSFLSGIDLGLPVPTDGSDTTANNTKVVATAIAGSGLQPGTANTYFYNRLDLADNATKGTFTGTIYVRPGETENTVIDQLVLESGVHRLGVEFSGYTAIDDGTSTAGEITMSAVQDSMLYIGDVVVVLERYIPTVEDVAPAQELDGFTPPT